MTQNELKSVLHYCPISGLFTWKVKPAKQIPIGAVAGCETNGYIQIRLFGQLHYAHRLAVLYMTGKLPVELVDHDDGDGTNNTWGNLNQASSTQNRRNASTSKNNTSGILGVCWVQQRGMWRAAIGVAGRTKFLGYFSDISEAAAVRKAAEQHYNFNPNHGR